MNRIERLREMTGQGADQFRHLRDTSAEAMRDVAARVRERGLGESLNDWKITTKYQADIARDLGGWVLRAGPKDLVRQIDELPWFRDFLIHFEKFFARLVFPRTAHYREANAMLVRYIVKIVFPDLLGKVFAEPERTVLHEDIIPTEIFHAMGLSPWMAEIVGILLPMVHGSRIEEYIDSAENYGITPDTCSLPKSAMGMTLAGCMPKPVAMVASNMPCDTAMAGYIVMEEALGVPTYRLDIPHDFKSDRAVTYFAEELRKMIVWLEANTPGRMDWNKLRSICETRNKTLQLEMDLWELLRNKPSPMAGEPITYNHFLFMQLYPGHPDGIAYFERLLEITDDAVRKGKGAIANERYRALLWNPMTLTYPDLYTVNEKRWGMSIMMDMLAFRRHPIIDTSTPESMLRDLAVCTMNGPMARHTRGPVENFFQDLFYLVDHFDIDMVMMAEHVGCKNTKALNGMFRELCRDRGIPLLFINDDMTDSRVVSGKDIQRQIDNFMESVMGATPLR